MASAKPDDVQPKYDPILAEHCFINMLKQNYIKTLSTSDLRKTEYKLDYQLYGQADALNPLQRRLDQFRNNTRFGNTNVLSGTAFTSALNYTSVIHYNLGSNLGQGAYA